MIKIETSDTNQLTVFQSLTNINNVISKYKEELKPKTLFKQNQLSI